MDAIRGTVEVLSLPIRVASGIPVAVTDALIDTVVKGPELTQVEGTPNAHEQGQPMLELSSLIYYYSELRSATKIKLREYAEEKKISIKNEDGKSCGLLRLSNQINDVLDKQEKMGTSSDPDTAQKEYIQSLENLNNLTSEHDLNLTDGDVEVFKQYFSILSKKPKYTTDVKKDIVLYQQYIDPLFRMGFGGSDYNVKIVEKLVKLDETQYIYYIDDDFTTTSIDVTNVVKNFSSEVVYAIVVSEKNKTISVVFRGSVNSADWVSNLQVNSTKCYFPGFTTPEAEKNPKEFYGLVHEGFYEYLCGETKAGWDGSTKSKAEEIMGHLTHLVNENPGFNVYITGHSLGGALSTLMSMRAASKFELKTTVINVSFASPFVGDQQFRDKFYELEQEGKIKHLRFSNYEDVVPLVPYSTLTPIGPCAHTYKHTGINVKLFNKTLVHPYHYKLSYPMKDSWPNELRNAMRANIFNGFNVNILNHLLDEYNERLNNGKEEIQMINIFSLYAKPTFTGWESKLPNKISEKRSPERTGTKE